MTTYRRCMACTHWYEKSLGDCPECEAEPSKHNKWLAKASLNSQLYKQAEASLPKNQEKATYDHYRKKIKSAVKDGVWADD